MKKLFLIILFIVIINYGFTEIHGNLEMGYIPEIQGYSLNLILSYDFWQITLYGGYETLADHNNLLSFNPYRETYIIGFKLDLIDNIYFKTEHSCTHAVYSYKEQFYDKYAGGNRTDIKIGIKW